MKINNTEKKNGEHTDLIIYCVVVFLGFLVISQRLKIEPTQRTEVSPDATAKRTEKGSLKLAILASDSSRGRDIFLDGSPLRGSGRRTVVLAVVARKSVVLCCRRRRRTHT